jgi:hypothetical protein
MWLNGYYPAINSKKMKLTTDQQNELLQTLKKRFEKNMHRHPSVLWAEVEARLLAMPEKLWSLYQMEETGGEPDVLGKAAEVTNISTSKYKATIPSDSKAFLFVDFAPETPKGRRSICYDQEALDARKENKPRHSAVGMAREMGVELMTEEQYFGLQAVETVDTKTSSWLKTEEAVRQKGGAIFGDWRYGRVFIYHNGADSYYAVRGFRAVVLV